jgi:hypothetical protein
MRYADFGSVSHGTLRDEDLLQAFADELESLLAKQSRRFRRAPYRALIRAARKELRNYQRLMSGRACGGFWCAKAGLAVGDYVNRLADTLNEFAPPYAYFGAHEGNGSDFGFWLDRDALDESFDGLRVGDTSEVPRDYRGDVLHVNDHGNVTLYVAGSRGRLREVWAVV